MCNLPNINFEDISTLYSNTQCKVVVLLRQKCLDKWLSMGNNSCP